MILILLYLKEICMINGNNNNNYSSIKIINDESIAIEDFKLLTQLNKSCCMKYYCENKTFIIYGS